MTYKDILNDKKILDIYNKIDKKNISPILHGKQHVLNVIDNLEKLSKVIYIDNKDLELLKIAITLHDIGHIYEKDIHPIKSYEFAKEYLQDKINTDDLEKIISAIKNHHEKENINNITLFEHILLFIDKMDFTNKRLNLNHKTREYLIQTDILDINFEIDNNSFYLIVKTNNINKNKLKYWDYYPKIVKRINEFSHKLNKNYEIKII